MTSDGRKLADVRNAARQSARSDQPPKSARDGRYMLQIGGVPEWQLVRSLRLRLGLPTDAAVVRRALEELERTHSPSEIGTLDDKPTFGIGCPSEWDE